MRSPWTSFIVGIIGLMPFGPFAMCWILPVMSRPSGGIIIDSPLIFFIPAALGVAVSVFGLIVGTGQVRTSLQPRWPIAIGIAMGFLNTVIWVGSVGFIVLKMLSVYFYVF